MRHKFKINGGSRERIISDVTLLGVFAILEIGADRIPGTNPRTLAASFLRQTGGMAVEDAYIIVDYVSANGSLDKNGVVALKKPETVVEYSAI